jgi:transposase
MARPYSLDLRQRVVAQVARGMTRQAVADLNGIVSSTVTKWCGRERQSGTPAAKPMGGHRPRKLEDERDWILTRLAAKPDLTLHALLDDLRAHGVVVACDTLWRFLKREEITFKKNLVRRRAGSARRRAPSHALAKISGPD